MQDPIPYATAVTIEFAMVKRGAIDLAVGGDWTPQAGDVKLSLDHGALTNTTNLPVNSPASSCQWTLDLTVAETTGKRLFVQIVDATTKAVEDNSLFLYTYGHPSAAIPRDLVSVEQVRVKKNTALANFPFLMQSAAGTPLTGLTVTATRSLDGTAFAACANAVTEVGSGWYKINLAATDTNADTIALKFTAPGARARNIAILTGA